MKQLRRFALVLTLIVAFPIFGYAGHATTGGAYCPGDPPYCGHPDGGLMLRQDDAEEIGQEDASDLSGTLMLAFTVLMIVTRLRPSA